MRIYLDNLSSYISSGSLEKTTSVKAIKKDGFDFKLYEVRSFSWGKFERVSLIFKTCSLLLFTFGLAYLSEKVKEQCQDMLRSRKFVAFYLKETKNGERPFAITAVSSTAKNALPQIPTSKGVMGGEAIQGGEGPISRETFEEGKILPATLKEVALDLSDQKLEDGINPKKLGVEQKNALLQLAYNWEKREDQKPLHYTLGKLSGVLKIGEEELQELLLRLAITYGDEIPIYAYTMNELSRNIKTYIWDPKGFKGAKKQIHDLNKILSDSLQSGMAEDPNKGWLGCKKSWSPEELAPIFNLPKEKISNFFEGMGCKLNALGRYETEDLFQSLREEISTSFPKRWEAYQALTDAFKTSHSSFSFRYLELSRRCIEERKKAPCPPLEAGLAPSHIKREEKKFRQWIETWGKKWPSKKESYSIEELEKELSLNNEEIEAFLNRLQILQRPIPTLLLNYYFKGIENVLEGKGVPVLLDTFHNFWANDDTFSSPLAHSHLRFPPLSLKEKWTLEELSLYLAIEKDFLFDKLQEKQINLQDGFYLSTDISHPFLKELFHSLKSLDPSPKIEKESIRFAGLGAGSLLL